jgi:hypothetical protein
LAPGCPVIEEAEEGCDLDAVASKTGKMSFTACQQD